MPVFDDLGEVLEEKGNHEQTDVHAVHIGIGGNDNLIVAEAIDALLDVQSRLQEEELLVAVDCVSPKAKGVEGLTAKAEDGLSLGIAAFGNGARGRVALGDEYGTLLASDIVGIGEVNGAVAELAVVEVSLLGLVSGLLLQTRDGFAFLLAVDDFFVDYVGHLGVSPQVVVEMFGEEVAHIVSD